MIGMSLLMEKIVHTIRAAECLVLIKSKAANCHSSLRAIRG
jgi:hypothetical protein